MRTLLASARVVVVSALVSGCATAPAPLPAPVTVRQRAARVIAPPAHEPEPLVVEGPEPEPPAEAPPPEGDEPFEEGMASYYADMLSGNKTASGERYHPDRRTCAHRTQPFGTVLEVTATGSGRTSTCRVNDRGPFAKGRVLDVSKKVARELGMITPGVLRVRMKQAHSSGDPG